MRQFQCWIIYNWWSSFSLMPVVLYWSGISSTEQCPNIAFLRFSVIFFKEWLLEKIVSLVGCVCFSWYDVSGVLDVLPTSIFNSANISRFTNSMMDLTSLKIPLTRLCSFPTKQHVINPNVSCAYRTQIFCWDLLSANENVYLTGNSYRNEHLQCVFQHLFVCITVWIKAFWVLHMKQSIIPCSFISLSGVPYVIQVKHQWSCAR